MMRVTDFPDEVLRILNWFCLESTFILKCTSKYFYSARLVSYCKYRGHVQSTESEYPQQLMLYELLESPIILGIIRDELTLRQHFIGNFNTYKHDAFWQCRQCHLDLLKRLQQLPTNQCGIPKHPEYSHATASQLHGLFVPGLFSMSQKKLILDMVACKTPTLRNSSFRTVLFNYLFPNRSHKPCWSVVKLCTHSQ